MTLEVTAVRADGKLAMRQDAIDKHSVAITESGDKELEQRLADMIANHNKARSPCGQKVVGKTPSLWDSFLV